MNVVDEKSCGGGGGKSSSREKKLTQNYFSPRRKDIILNECPTKTNLLPLFPLGNRSDHSHFVFLTAPTPKNGK
jgi:hypothetical protein